MTAQKNRSVIYCFLLLFFSDRAWAALGQEITIGLPSVTYQKATLSRNYSGSAPVGFAGEYALYLNPRLCASGQFELNLESSEQTALFIGGGAGLKFYALGGEENNVSDLYIKGSSRSKWNVFLLVGFGGKQFDFSVPEKAVQPQDGSVIVQKDAKDVQKGSAFGLNLGFGISTALADNVEPGLRLQMFKSFSAENQPSISATSIWLQMTFKLHGLI